jgi:hypothetical protein
MTKEEKELYQRLANETYMLKAWGEFVYGQIIDYLKNIGINSADFLKIDTPIRIKDADSLIAKAFYRNKGYKNPYEDITDKVGIRFVVLLEDDVKRICDAIESINKWTYSKDRDYEIERSDEPFLFNYQSMHYVVKSQSILNFKGIDILKNTPCEIQIRTLLQHAYSELTHDKIYKSNIDPTSETKRVIAKSMALLETTDEFFQKANNIINQLPIFKLYEVLKNKFTAIHGVVRNISKANTHILYAYYDFINEKNFTKTDFDEFDEIVKFNLNKTYLNDQPIIYFVYYLCEYNKNIAKTKWPYTMDELTPYFTQLGKTID